MSGNFKKSKAELVAIYRLEFYRNQKNWKFCNEVRRQKAAEKKLQAQGKQKLNKTYSVEPQDTKEDRDVLNKAFVETVPDDTPPSDLPDSPKGAPESPEEEWVVYKDPPKHHHSAESSFPKNVESQNWIGECPKITEVWTTAQDQKCTVSDTIRKPNMDWTEPIYPERCEKWPQTMSNVWDQWPNEHYETQVEYSELTEMDRGYEGTESSWPVKSGIWTNDGQVLSDGFWSADVIRELELLNVQQLEPEFLDPDWVPQDQLLHWMLTKGEGECPEVMCANDSASDFMRGAHVAPHSSEAEIDPDIDVLNWSEPCPQLLSSLPERVLVSQGRSLARALRSLAAELRERDRIREEAKMRSRVAAEARSPSTVDVSEEELPTRDVGLRPPDTLLAGSHLCCEKDQTLECTRWCALSPPLGRGRARLAPPAPPPQTPRGRGRL